MNYLLNFFDLLEYDPGEAGIQLPIVLHVGQRFASFDAKLDTGASHCIFARTYGEELGFDIEAGYSLTVSTATGYFIAYGHYVTLSLKDFTFDVMVYLARDHAFNRNVLGRHGFLNLVRLGLIDYDGKLFLSRRDEPDSEG